MPPIPIAYTPIGYPNPPNGSMLFCVGFLPREGFFLQHIPADISEGLLLAPVTEHFQQEHQLLLGLWVHQRALHAFLKILQRRRIRIGLALVSHAGGSSIHDHFHQELSGHRQRLVTLGLGIQIRPVFIMMAVATLMVHPGFAVALDFPFCGVGTAVALVMLGTVPKLHEGLFGQIVGQALPIQTHPEAAAHN